MAESRKGKVESGGAAVPDGSAGIPAGGSRNFPVPPREMKHIHLKPGPECPGTGRLESLPCGGPCLLLLSVAVITVALCALLTGRQLGHWRNSETIFQHTLAVTKDNAIIHYNLGTTLGAKGQTDEAIAHLQEAIRIKPNYAGARNNLAVMLVDLGRLPEAVLQYQEAIRLRPDDANTRFNLGVAQFKQGQLDAALEQFQAAARLNPNDVEAQNRVKLTTELKQAAALCANAPARLNNLAWGLATSPNATLRSGGLAVSLAERAGELTQNQVTVMLGTLAAAYAEAGRFDEAVATAQKAIALATERGETQLLQRNAELLKLYQNHQPYHER
jgi:tetratricopeptide (TPR) repeat protein